MVQGITRIGTTLGMVTLIDSLSRKYWLPFFPRVLTVILGVTSIVWGLTFFEPSYRQDYLDPIASDFLAGRPIRIGSLFEQDTRLNKAEKMNLCDPRLVQDTAVIRLGILNEAIAGSDAKLTGMSYDALHASTLRALSCTPSDPFLWLILFWLDVSKKGVGLSNMEFLRLSYELGPREGWIGVWRVRLAVSLFDKLAPDLANDSVNEFKELLETNRSYAWAADTFIGADAMARDRIVDSLKTAQPSVVRNFVDALDHKGLSIEIPSVNTVPDRPWHQ
jgi:hypothetical protein